jgi:hypothetical protein
MPVLERFVAQFKNGEAMRRCRQQHPESTGELLVTVSLDDPPPDQAPAPIHPSVELLGGRALDAFEDCAAAALAAAAATFDVPPRTAPAQLERVRVPARVASSWTAPQSPGI